MKLKKLFSPKALVDAVRTVVDIFPAPSCFLAVWTIWMLLYVTDVIDPSDNLSFAFPWACCLGFFLTTAVSIWTEYLDRMSLRKPILAIATLLVIADFIIILVYGTGSQAGEIGRTALMTGIIVAIFFLPLSKGLDKGHMTAYTFRQFTVAAAAICLALILAISIFIIYGTLEALFGKIDIRIFQALLVIFCGTAQGVFYLRYQPRRKEIIHEHPDSLNIIAVCAKNIILPICMVYMVILYVYGLKILFTWTLPNGILTWSVTGLSVVSLIVLYCIQPLCASGNKISIPARRLLPLLMMPLIVLMSVGLIYRFGEYGPTASRVYVALFAAWAFVTFLWLSVSSSANMNLIATTFAGAFIAVSVIPGLNVSDLVNKYIHRQILTVLDGHKLPLKVKGLKEVIASMPDKEAKLTASRIAYLDSWDDHTLVRDIVRSESKVTEWELCPDSLDEEVLPGTVTYDISEEITAIPEGFNTMQNVEVHYGHTQPRHYTDLQFDSISVNIPTDSIAAHGLDTPLIRPVNDTSVFLLTDINIHQGDSTFVTRAGGIIFSRR
ncbi:MAG: DUF4153 domain-containing protein [Muribaculaceae bacterium]|nr:DUF4153 domain-containing protein [Muribaculaceae bacterium]